MWQVIRTETVRKFFFPSKPACYSQNWFQKESNSKKTLSLLKVIYSPIHLKKSKLRFSLTLFEISIFKISATPRKLFFFFSKALTKWLKLTLSIKFEILLLNCRDKQWILRSLAYSSYSKRNLAATLGRNSRQSSLIELFIVKKEVFNHQLNNA